MNYKCYFCHHDISNAKASRIAPIFDCFTCSLRHNLHRVITVWNEYDELLYAHIYPEHDVKMDAGYHIRLHLKENYTNIDYRDSNGELIDTIMTLPGYPLKPSNVEDKLKLYILFS